MQIHRSLTHDELQRRLQVALREGTPNIAQTLVGLNVRTSYTHAGRLLVGSRIMVVTMEMLQMHIRYLESPELWVLHQPTFIFVL